MRQALYDQLKEPLDILLLTGGSMRAHHKRNARNGGADHARGGFSWRADQHPGAVGCLGRTEGGLDLVADRGGKLGDFCLSQVDL